MTYKGGILSAELPHQAPAGKLEYKITLQGYKREIVIPEDKPVVIRFKGEVPLIILIPHVIAMFGAMLLSTRTGLECFNKEPNLKKFTFWALGFLVVGGMIIGPLAVFYAFGTWWTGFPLGSDLTDNKTLVALIGWIIAAIALYKSRTPQAWVLFASVLLILAYLIPHSLVPE